MKYSSHSSFAPRAQQLNFFGKVSCTTIATVRFSVLDETSRKAQNINFRRKKVVNSFRLGCGFRASIREVASHIDDKFRGCCERLGSPPRAVNP